MKSSWIAIVFIFTSLFLSGCAGNEHAGDNNNSGTANQVNPMDVNYIPKNTNNKNENLSRNLAVSDRAKRNIEQLDEIVDARVIIYHNNAYVAVRTDRNDNNGSDDENVRKGKFENNNQKEDGNVIINDALDGNIGTFMENGTVNSNRMNTRAADGVVDGDVDAGKNVNSENENKLSSNGHRPQQVTNTLEQKIAKQVRKTVKGVNNVYTSTDPDTFDRMNAYVDSIRTNGDNETLVAEFNEMVNVFFGDPTN